MTMREFVPLAVLVLATSAPALHGQDAPPPRPDQPPTTELVFEREVFTYPSFDRRNPFLRLSANADGGPRFETISLRTIIYSSDPSRSLAIFMTGGDAGPGGPEGLAEVTVESLGEMRRLRRGESWGNMRLLEIQRDRVVVETSQYGVTETHTMLIPRAGQGGS